MLAFDNHGPGHYDALIERVVNHNHAITDTHVDDHDDRNQTNINSTISSFGFENSINLLPQTGVLLPTVLSTRIIWKCIYSDIRTVVK